MKTHCRHHIGIIIALLALFFLRIFAWATADLWYDEILTLRLFVLSKTSIGAIFRDYCIANNHFLNSALEWLWLKVPFVDYSSELLLRIPAILTSCGTLLLIALCWPKWLGQKLSYAMALLFALSPIFTAFAYQLRGYSIAMFLATAAVTAAYARHQTPNLRNGAMIFILSLLLPLTMPSAGMVGGALTFALFFGPDWRLFSWTNIRRALPAFCGTALGCAYYLTLWTQFQHARIDSGGWTNGAVAFFHVIFAFALHLSIFLTGYAALACKKLRQRNADTLQPNASPRFAWLLSIAVIFIIALLLAVPSSAGRVAFPRVFLVMLPLLSFAAALLCTHTQLTSLSPKTLALAIALPTVIITLFTEQLNRYLLTHRATPPQNLLFQYYRGQNDASALLYRLEQLQRAGSIPGTPRMVVSPYDSPAVEHYWLLAGRVPVYADGSSSIILTTRINDTLPRNSTALFFLRDPDAAALNDRYKLQLIERIGVHALYIEKL